MSRSSVIRGCRIAICGRGARIDLLAPAFCRHGAAFSPSPTSYEENNRVVKVCFDVAISRYQGNARSQCR
jgi:hypothetical protein